MSQKLVQYDDQNQELPEVIHPLPNDEDYNSLSEEDLIKRSAAVYDAAARMLSLVAINYSGRVKKATSYLLNEVKEYQELGVYSGTDGVAQKQLEMKLARKLVEGDEFCGTVLDRLVSFCLTPGNIENVKDKKLLNILNQWKDTLGNMERSAGGEYIFTQPGLFVVLEQILERLFVDGDAVVSEVWEKDVLIDGEPYVLPHKLNVHDTLLIDYDYDSFVSTGEEKLFINLEFSSPTSRDIVKKTVKTRASRIPLFSEGGFPFTAHFKLRPKKFVPWGTSLFRRAFYPVADKKRLEALEQSTVEGLISRLTILLAGKLDPQTGTGIIAPQRLAVLERLLAQPKVNNLLIWPGDDLEVKDIGPNSDILSYDKKYADVNERILVSLGFPRVLVDGESSSTENWQKFLGIISFFDKIRNNYIVPWINYMLRRIAVENGYEKEFPRFSFTKIRLSSPADLLNAVKVYYDRGLMSELTAITSFDGDYDIEQMRRKYEAKEGILEKHGPPQGLPFTKNAPDGTVKNPQGAGKQGKEAVSTPGGINEKGKTGLKLAASSEYRDSLVSSFDIHLKRLYAMYSSRILEAVKRKEYDRVEDILFVFATEMKKDTKAHMISYFNDEIEGIKYDTDLLEKSILWVNSFVDGLASDLGKEVRKIVSNNKQQDHLLVELVGGFLGTFEGSRVRLYSSAVYNKAKAAGIVTSLRAEGKDTVEWNSAMTEATCAYCAEMHGKVMSLDAFFAEFPPHSGCECWGKGSEEVISEDVPVKDPKNWSSTI